MAGPCEVAARLLRQPLGIRAERRRAMATTETRRGSAAVQGELWGARARDWADLQEPVQHEIYPPVLDAAGVGAGTILLDVGCGSGVAASIAAARGARVHGI